MKAKLLLLLALLCAAAIAPAQDDGPPPVRVKPTQTATGLQIYEIEKGVGSPVWKGMRVRVHYTGWLADSGKMFDSSRTGGRPLSFTIGDGSMIKGFTEGVAGMRVGGKRRIVIPPELGYGKAGSRGIPPNATLIFDVELAGIG